MTEYEIAVRCLSSRNTHLKLRERCRLALRQMKVATRPLPADYMQDLQLAIYRRRNAVIYQQTHFPGWNDLPAELRQTVEEGYPVSGHGMAQLNTMLGLKKLAEEEEARITLPDISDPEDAEIDQMVADYLAYRKTITKRTPD